MDKGRLEITIFFSNGYQYHIWLEN